jgi:glutamate-ammonia-ligase adenylyltransferase
MLGSGGGSPPHRLRTLRLPQAELEFLVEQVTASPDPPSLVQFLTRFDSKNGLPVDRQQLLVLATLAGQSPFLGELVMQNPEYLGWAAAHLHASTRRSAEDLREELARFRFTFSRLSDGAAMRRFKLREYVQIALRDFFGKSDLTEVTGSLSVLADVLLEEACRLTLREMQNHYGTPQYHDDSGWLCEASFAILAFGKLGGGELNYSSDIDLVYLYSREGQTGGSDAAGKGVITNREFFTKVGEGITQRIAGISAEGQVFRVDLGLRPGGKDGELVQSQRSLLSYYRTWARAWERQALIKVRPCAGDRALGESVARALKEQMHPSGRSSFVALEIKEMKDRIDEELSRAGQADLDLKLGRGGIRELEFGIQALQLAHGPAEPWVHEGNTLRALHRLADKDFVSYGEHAGLARAYGFLRKAEHRLQLERNRQTYLLPSGDPALRILARRMGYLDPHGRHDFLKDLEVHRRAVREFYDRVLNDLSQPALQATEPDPLLDPFPGDALPPSLVRGGRIGSEESRRLFERIRRLLSPERMAPDERRDMRRISNAILQEVVSAPEPERTLVNLERFLSSLLLEAPARRALFDKAEWVPPLVHVLAQSEHLGSALTRHPRVLAKLGNLPLGPSDATRTQGAAKLRKSLKNARHLKEAGAALRRFHQSEILITGLRDVHRQDSLATTLRRLTSLAETCLTGAEDVAARISGGEPVTFCTLGLGRLGYQELDYSSDLDLIFLYRAEGDPSRSREAARLRAEAMIHLLTAITREGALYSVDLRLRPAGGEGDLVQSEARLLEYFASTAQTWEKLALLKARPVAGDFSFGEQLLQRLQELVFRDIRRASLGGEVLEMKAKIEQSIAPPGTEGIPLKWGWGGVMEIHFLIEYLQIFHGIVGGAQRDTLRMLYELHSRSLLSDADYPMLYAAYLLFRSLDHSMRLLYDRPGDFLPLTGGCLSRLANEVRLTLSSTRKATADSLLALIEESRRNVRECFLKTVV